ncbi:helix-turn-helix domain-containing protein [Nocardia asiatica]|uniref:helix-turn-helix domain-containing protein n=1 Tax=Nocardia asiatica TaxID=209252 RepID=UPI0002EFB453|nr:helix-turn-helix transcriptional regulator [Nocardia asiatica]
MDERAVDAFGYELASIAADALRGVRPHGQLLQRIGTLMDVDAAIVTRPDLASGSMHVLAQRGYGPEELRLMTTRSLLARDPALTSIRRDRTRPPIRWWVDPDYTYENSESAREFLCPAGFNGGMSIGYYTETGEHAGYVHLSTRARLIPSPAQLAVLERSLPVVAALLDATPVGPDAEVAVVEDGRLVFCADDVPHVDMQQVATLLGGLNVRSAPRSGSFRWRGSKWYRIDWSSNNLRVCAVVHREEPPHQLTAKEFEVLDHLCAGLTNADIAARMYLSERTIAHHVERILGKLGATTRTAAVAQAIHEALLLRPMWTPGAHRR